MPLYDVQKCQRPKVMTNLQGITHTDYILMELGTLLTHQYYPAENILRNLLALVNILDFNEVLTSS